MKNAKKSLSLFLVLVMMLSLFPASAFAAETIPAEDEASVLTEEGDALPALRRMFAERRYEAAPELPSLQGGAVGYVSYDAVSSFETRRRRRLCRRRTIYRIIPAPAARI